MKDQMQIREGEPTMLRSPRQKTLSELLEKITRDARNSPDEYLRETGVPGGGE